MAKLSRFVFFKNLLACFVTGSIIFSAAFTTVASAREVNESLEFVPEMTVSGSEAAMSPTGQTYLLDPDGTGSPTIDGKAYVLYDVQSDTFLLGKNQDLALPPASITKVMTVLLALEELKLTDTITVTREMFESIPYDYVRLGLVEGEKITVEDAICASLLISANDAALALAIKMGGSEAGFAEKMNAKAQKLGCQNTNFTNPYGYADKNNLISARDMAVILAEALKNDTYVRFSTAKQYTMPATNTYARARELYNCNRFISTTEYAYAPYIGGKTGYTGLSGATIAAGAKKNGRVLIGVILGASNSQIRYPNLISLFDYGFDTYSTTQVESAEYEEIKNTAVKQVETAIEEAGCSLSVSNVELILDKYTTTTSARDAGGYQCAADLSEVEILDGLDEQHFEFPLFRQYSDGMQNQVGKLEIVVSKALIVESSTIITDNTQRMTSTAIKNETPAIAGAGSGKTQLFLRIVLIVVLIMVFCFCILAIYAMLKHDVKKRNRRKRLRLD